MNGTINLTNSSQTSGGGYIVGAIDWTAEANKDANTSTVTANLFLKKAIYESTATTPTVGTWDCSLSVAGESISSGVYKAISGDWVLMLSKTVVVPHNADGTKTITISGAGWGPSGTAYSGKAAEGSGSVTLETIPRASSLSVGALTLGWDTNSVTITSEASGFRHDVYLKIGSKNVCMLHDVLAGKHKITPTLTDFANQITNAASGTGTLTLYTYNAEWSAQVGSKSYTVTVNIPSTVVPSITSTTIAEAVSGLAAKFGAYVQNKSQLAVSISASGAYGSTIARYETTIGGTVYRDRSFTSGVLGSSGSVSVVIKVTDSRGRSTSTTKTITVLPYSPPRITAITAERIDTSGNPDNDGNRFELQLAYSISQLGNKNDRTMTVKYKQSGGSYSNLATSTADWAYDGTIQYTDAPEVSPDNTYIVQVTLTDYFGSTSAEAELHTSASIMDFLADGTGVAIGKAAENSEQLDVAWPVLARQGITSGLGLELGQYAESHGGYIDFHFGGSADDYTSRIIENVKGEILIDALLKLSKALGIAYGGTGVTSTEALVQKVFGANQENWQNVTKYPTAPGIYRTVGTDIFRNLESTHGNYGVLVILKAAYALHIYVDEYSRMFYGRSSDTFGEPTWRRIDAIQEEGTSGIWTYRKYVSGWAECWGSKTYTGNPSTSWGSLYALTCTADNYPITFTDWPNVQRDVLLDNTAACWLVPWNNATKTNCGAFALVRTSNLALNATVKFHVTGHWK